MNDEAQTELLEALARARNFTDINIAAGIALEARPQHRRRPGGAGALVGLAVVLLALLIAFQPGTHLDRWGQALGHDLYREAT